jgi:PAS domain S-box-containing protein
MAEATNTKELETRLANAENLVNALRNLEIDAIIGEHHVAYVQLKEIADTIRISRELYRHILREAPIGIAEIDLETDLFITANMMLAEYTGYTREEFERIKIQQIFSPESFALFRRHIHDLSSNAQTPVQRQYKIRRKDGSEFWALIQTKLTYDHGQVKTAIIVINDITKQKNLEQEEVRLSSELYHEKELLDTIMENTHAHLAYLDDHLNFIRVNSAFARDFGSGSQAEFIGKNYFDVFLNKEDRMIIQDMMNSRQPVSLKGKTINSKKNLQTTYWNWAISPVTNKNGAIKGIVLSLMDITDLKQSENHVKELNWRLLRRTYDLQNVNKELESFSYSISHDLRAPLRRISGFSTALLEDCAAILDDQGKDYLKRIVKTSEQMDELIDALLRLSRLTRAPMDIQTVDLTAMAKEIIHDYEQIEPARKAEITIEDNLTVEADQNLMRTLLDNLIGNAWKFTRKSPTTRITIGKASETPNETTFYIKDNGIGFNMAHADKLFIPFQRLHPESEYPGTGIGLGIANRIINRHKGKIWAKSIESQGATFFISLPKTQPEST